jgi:hypothetical protein
MPAAMPTGVPSGRRPLWKSPRAWAIGIVVILVLGAIGSMGRSDPDASGAADTGTPTPAVTDAATPTMLATATEAPPTEPTRSPYATLIPTVDPTSAPLVVIAPSSGATVADNVVIVTGIAPPGARIVRDISFAPDDEVIAGPDGGWSMAVTLDAGSNRLVFRVGDDSSTEEVIDVTFTPRPSTSQPDPTSEPLPTPQPAPRFATIDDGTWEVGRDIKPGTYRIREPAFFCYWARLKNFSGSLGAIIANDNVTAYSVITIRASDKGFETSGCPTWTKDLSQVTGSKTRFGEGTFIVGTDLRPGTFRNTGGEFCYWARLRDFRGQLSSIIANDLASRRTIVTIKSSDTGFESSGCGDWIRQ